MRSWAKLMVEENPSLGRLYRNHGGRPIGGEVAVRILDDHAVLDVSLKGLRPLTGGVKVLRGPLAAAASPISYQAWLFSEKDEKSVKMGLFNAERNGSARITVDFDPNDICRMGLSINGFDCLAIAPLIEGYNISGAITIAFTRLPGDLSIPENQRTLPTWLVAESGGLGRERDDSDVDDEAAESLEEEGFPWEPGHLNRGANAVNRRHRVRRWALRRAVLRELRLPRESTLNGVYSGRRRLIGRRYRRRRIRYAPDHFWAAAIMNLARLIVAESR